MATLEFFEKRANFPKYIKYTNDAGIGLNRTEGGSSRAANYDGSDNNLSPKIRSIIVNKISSVDWLSSIAVPSDGVILDATRGNIEIKYQDRYLFLTNETFETYKKVHAFVFGINPKVRGTAELS